MRLNRAEAAEQAEGAERVARLISAFSAFTALTALTALSALTACARIEPPPAGPPDPSAPRLIATRPDSFARLTPFEGVAEFQFDEVVSEGSAPNRGEGTG